MLWWSFTSVQAQLQVQGDTLIDPFAGTTLVAPVDTVAAEAVAEVVYPDVASLSTLAHPIYSTDCAFAFTKVNEFSGAKMRGLRMRPFFAFSPEAYAKFEQEKAFFEGAGFVVESEGQLVLELHITVQSTLAEQEFGIIEADAPLYIWLITGERLELRSVKQSLPEVEGSSSTYICKFPLQDRKTRAALAEVEIDKIRLDWSRGYKTFEIFHVDFLKKQLPCFE